MEVLIIFGIFAVLAYIVYTKLNKEDENGRHPLDAVTIAKVEETAVKTVAEVKAAEAKVEQAVTNVVTEVKEAEAKVEQAVVSVLDVNKDGKVNVDDVKEVVTKTKAAAKKAVKKTKAGK